MERSRAMAEETVDEAIKEFNLETFVTGRSQTDKIKLIGGHAWTPTMYIKLIQQFGLETDVAKHLSEDYGDRAWEVASIAESTGTLLSVHPRSSADSPGLSWPVHGTRLSPLYPYIEAEVRHAARREYALHAVDFIARRARISFLNVQVTLEILPRVIDLMGDELHWDAATKEREFEAAQEFLKSMGLPPDQPKLKLADVQSKLGNIGSLTQSPNQGQYARAQFTPDEVHSLRAQFEQLDRDHDQHIDRGDLQAAITRMGYERAADAETAENILDEVDFNHKGYVEFSDYLDIAAGVKELSRESAFTHVAQMDSSRKLAEGGDDLPPQAKEDSKERAERRAIPTERSGGGT